MLVSSAVRKGKMLQQQKKAASAEDLSSQPAQGSEGTASVETMAAILRGCFPAGAAESQWHGCEEELGEKHVKFLKAWYGKSLGPVNHVRKAWTTAFPSLHKASVNAILSKIGAIRQYLMKKNRNAKTGEQMAGWMKDVLGVLRDCQPQVAPKRLSGESLRSLSKESSGASLRKAQESPGEGLRKAQPKVSKVCAPGPESADSEEASILPSDVEIVSSSEVAPSSAAASTPVASLRSSPCKKPAAGSGSLKAQGKAKAKAKSKAKAKAKSKVLKSGETWKTSPSFGYVKITHATEKSYIQFRKTPEDKFALLVNVQGLPKRKDVADQLFSFVRCQAGLDKAQVISKRNELMDLAKG